MSPRRTICPRISITSSTEGGACGHSRLDSSAGLARVWLVAASLALAAQASAQLPAAQPAGAAGQPRLAVGYGNLPLSFEANQGQSEERVKFLARGQGYSLFLTPTEVVLSLRAPAQHKPAAAEHAATGTRAEFDEPAQSAAVVRMRLVGANKDPQLTGFDPLPGTSNYFIGNDPARWQRDVPNYARVKYAGVYPGVDLVYYGNQRQLEYDIVVAPGADPGRIALAFEGVQKLSLDSEGNLVLQTSQGDIAQHKPVIYQDIGGKRQRVDGRYVLRAKHRVGFQVASYDTTQPLVIDPVLVYSTYLGGNGNDIGYAIAVDSTGNAYVTGVTTSTNFPGTGGSPIQPSWLGSNDVFVTKLNAAGNALVYSTYLGGSGGDTGYAIAVDSIGNAYVTGETDSPTVAGPGNISFPRVGSFQASYNGGGDAFVTKINAAGNALVYSSYLGGSGTERGYGIAVDGSGNAYVTGHTSSSQGSVPSLFDFPTVAPFQSQNASLGNFDAFVTKINADGSALVYSTFLGGNGSEYSTYGGAIAVDSDGNAYVGGTTASTNFPGVSTSTIQATYGGGTKDGFVVKFNAAGSALLYSTYLGGNGFYDEVNGIAIDAARNAYVVGYTDALDFPTVSPLQASRNGSGNDAFVSKINAAGSALMYSTYLGGSGGDVAYAVAVDSGGNAYVSGWTSSSDFPTVAPLQAVAGSGDAFISELNPAGSALMFSTYLGGQSGTEQAYGIALDSAGNAYVTGQTSSSNFPTAGPFQATLGGATDAFVAKIVGVAGTLALTPAALRFAGTNTNGTLSPITPAQPVTVTFSAPTSSPWTATPSQPWVQITNGAGTGSGTFTVGIVNPGNVLGTVTTASATITVTASGASNSPQSIVVNLTLRQAAANVAPFGLVDTPLQNAAGVVGTIGVTGWVVDDVGVAGVKIYRNCLSFEAATNCVLVGGARVVFVGDATLVTGARPDVEALYPAYPQANRAAWGYLLLTNLLPHVPNALMFGGQGSLTLYALATDVEGNQTWLGRTQGDQTPTTITLANDTIAVPFGAIDTPAQGQTVSGQVVNFGWALTPDSNTTAEAGDILVPLGGSTMQVFVDGVLQGTVAYNQCRGTVLGPMPAGVWCDDDVSSIFGNLTPLATFTPRTSNPTTHRNLDVGRGAIGAFVLNTATLANGVHTIVWGVTDSGARAEGIGSRYFTVLNTGADAGAASGVGATGRSPLQADRLADASPQGAGATGWSSLPVTARTGFDLAAPWVDVTADDAGVRRVQLPELGRLELRLGAVDAGYLAANGEMRDLPPGSQLEAATGHFTWAPGVGYYGTYRLTFVRAGELIAVDVTIRPVASATPGEAEIRMQVDLPREGETVVGVVRIAGWALDPQAAIGSGIDAVHVWAQRRDLPGAWPEFLGAAALGGMRPDVAQAFGPQFGTAAFDLTTTTLASGQYDLTVYVWNHRTARWEDARTVSVTVR